MFVLSWPFLVYAFGWFGSEKDILGRYLFACAGMLMVAFSAFVTRTFVEKGGYKDVGWNPGHYTWYLIVLLFCIFLWLGPLLVAFLFGKLEWDHHPGRDEVIVVALSLGGFSLLAGFGEEFGWRGYLVPRLLTERKYARYILVVVGFVWGVWHCAVALGPFLKAILETPSDWLSLVGSTLLRCGQMIAASVALSFIFGAVWLKNKSIFLSSFLHGCYIGIRDAVAILAVYPAAFRLVTLACVLVAWFIAYRWLQAYEHEENIV